MGQSVLETAHNRGGSSHWSLKITAGSQNNFKKPTCWNLISPFLEVIPRTFPIICPLSSCHEFGSRLQPGFSDQFCSLPFCLSLQGKSRLKWSGLDSVAAHNCCLSFLHALRYLKHPYRGAIYVTRPNSGTFPSAVAEQGWREDSKKLQWHRMLVFRKLSHIPHLCCL